MLVIKSNNQNLLAILEVGESVEIMLRSKCMDGTSFEAYDSIRVINPGRD